MATNPLRLIGTDVVAPAQQRIPTEVTPVAVNRQKAEEEEQKRRELDASTREIQKQETALKVEGTQALIEQNSQRLSNRQQALGSLVQEVGSVVENLTRIEAQRDTVRQAYAKQAVDEAEARTKELDAQANIEALDKSSAILLQARDTINEQGREVALPLLRRDLMQVLEDAKKSGMQNDTYLEVQRYINTELAKAEDDSFQRYYNEARTTSEAISSVSYDQFRTQQASLFANLSNGVASTDPGQRQIALDQLLTNAHEFPGLANLDAAGKMQFLRAAYSDIQKSVAEGSEAYNDIQLKLSNTNQGLQLIQDIATAEEQGLITPDAAIIARGNVVAQFGISESSRGWTQSDSIKRETEFLEEQNDYARAVNEQKIARDRVTFGTQLEVGHTVALIRAGKQSLAQLDEGGFKNQVSEALNNYNSSEATLKADRARIGSSVAPGSLQTERAILVSQTQLDQAQLDRFMTATTEEEIAAMTKQFGSTADQLRLRITQNTTKIQGLDAEERQVSQRVQQVVQTLTPFGLHEGFERQQEFYNSAEAQAARAEMEKARAEIRAEDRQGFNRGNPNAPQTPARPLARIGDVGFVPFEAGADVGVTSSRGQRNGRHHAGLDLGVTGNVVGTPITAVTSGTVSFAGVISGYGNTVILNDGNGHDQMYAHLNNISVKEGDVIRQGTRVGGMGGSGTNDSGGLATSVYVPHLHFEVRTKDGNAGTDVDPVAYLARVKPEAATGETGLGLPPTQTSSSGNGVWNTSAVALPTSAVMNTAVGSEPPPGAFILPDGSWMSNSTIYYPNEEKRAAAEARRRAPSTTAYYAQRVPGSPSTGAVGGDGSKPGDVHHPARPLRGTLAAMGRADYPAKNDPAANYGYGAIAQDHQFRRKLAQVADKLNIPAQWLADVMAFETGGTFDPSLSNRVSDYNGGRGCVGLIQFCFIDNYDQMASKTRTQQLDDVYEYFKPNAGKMETVYDVWASVWAGLGEGYGGRGNEIAGSNISDGYITGNKYSRQIGSHAGRRYAHPADRGDSAIHSKPVSGCHTCQAMQQSKSFASHVAQG